MSLNTHQRAYIEYLRSLAPEQLCWCGWYPLAECGKWCERHGRGLTNADRVRESCVECGSSPFEPGGHVSHTRACSARDEAD